MSIFLLVTTICAAWVSGMLSSLMFHRRGGWFNPLLMLIGSIYSGVCLVGYVATNPLG